MYLLVLPAGGRYWRYDYTYLGRRSTLVLSVYPDVSVARAREKRESARQRAAQAGSRQPQMATARTFREIRRHD